MDCSLREMRQKIADLRPDSAVKILNILAQHPEIEYIEAGFVDTDKEFLRIVLAASHAAKITVFGRATMDTAREIIDLGAPVATLVAKARKRDVERSLGLDPIEYLDMVAISVGMLVSNGIEVIFDAEHLFDAIKKDDKEYAVSLLRKVLDAGARWLVLCDTNGSLQIKDLEGTVKYLVARGIPINKIGIHLHNDRGRAIALAEAAFELGVEHFQGTFTGHGERAGNLPLSVFVPNLVVDYGFVGVSVDNLKQYFKSYQRICELFGIDPDPNMPWVGGEVFGTSAGLHISGDAKDKGSYLHESPEIVGNKAKIKLTPMGGKSALRQKAKEVGIEIPEDRLDELFGKFKELYGSGVLLGDAKASLCLWLKKELGLLKTSFFITSCQLVDNCVPGIVINAKVTLEMTLCGQSKVSNATGEGPVNALENAIRGVLCESFPGLNSVRMGNYDLTMIDMGEGSAALVRIFCDFTDGDKTWRTVGVGKDSFKAALIAIKEGYHYKIAVL